MGSRCIISHFAFSAGHILTGHLSRFMVRGGRPPPPKKKRKKESQRKKETKKEKMLFAVLLGYRVGKLFLCE